jgi:HlyD family secretion protein
MRWILSGAALLIIAVASFALRGRSDALLYQTVAVDRGDVVEVVGATGTLQAVTTVQVGSQVSGTIQGLHADFNSTVKKGQVIARLDPSLFEARLGQARASLVTARANAERSRASVTDMKQKYERAQELAAQKLVPESDLETAKANYDGAVAQLKASEAAVTQAEANLNQAEVDLGHTVITTPIDGVVIARNVDVGQTVAASFQAPVLFIIANDLAQMQVNASIDEADIGRVRAGQDVTFRVDAYPERVFDGRVEQVRLQPTTVQNVVTYNTIIAVDNEDLRLMPGMTATVSVIVRKVEDVLRVRASALRFRPEGFDAAAWLEANRPAPLAPTAEASPAGGATAAAEAATVAPAAGAPGDRPAMRGGGAGSGFGGRGMGGGMAGGSGQGRPGAGRAGAAMSGTRGPNVIFALDAKDQPQPRLVRVGLSDGQYLAVMDGVQEGDVVVTGLALGGAANGGPQRMGSSPSANPFQPQRPQQRRRE